MYVLQFVNGHQRHTQLKHEIIAKRHVAMKWSMTCSLCFTCPLELWN